MPTLATSKRCKWGAFDKLPVSRHATQRRQPSIVRTRGISSDRNNEIHKMHSAHKRGSRLASSISWIGISERSSTSALCPVSQLNRASIVGTKDLQPNEQRKCVPVSHVEGGLTSWSALRQTKRSPCSLRLTLPSRTTELPERGHGRDKQ